MTKVTLPARTLEADHFQFLAENGMKITKDSKTKTERHGALRSDGSYSRRIKQGDVLAFDEHHMLYAKVFYEVCRQASGLIDARITPDALILTYSDGDMHTRVTLNWMHCDFFGYDVFIPYLDKEQQYRLYNPQPEPVQTKKTNVLPCGLTRSELFTAYNRLKWAAKRAGNQKLIDRLNKALGILQSKDYYQDEPNHPRTSYQPTTADCGCKDWEWRYSWKRAYIGACKHILSQWLLELGHDYRDQHTFRVVYDDLTIRRIA